MATYEEKDVCECFVSFLKKRVVFEEVHMLMAEIRSVLLYADVKCRRGTVF